MKIGKLETIRLHEFPNILWVRVHGEDGLYGLGETFMAAASVEAFLHEIVAPRILGTDAHAIDLIASKLYGYLGFRSSGVETRAASAVDIALCFGWIDSLIKKLDEERYARLFTPRRDVTKWSKVNLARVRVLLAEGRIDAGAPDRLKKALEANPDVGEVWLSSPGGDARARRPLDREQGLPAPELAARGHLHHR